MTTDYSLSDIAAVTDNNRNNGGLFGNDNGAIWLIVLFLFIFAGGWGNGGWGGNRGAGAMGGGAVDNYVLASDFAGIERKIDGVNNGLCDGFYTTAQLINGVQASTAQGFANAELSRCNQQATLMQQIFNLSTQLGNCCCDTQRQIERGFADTNYNLASQMCETRNLMQVNTRDIIDSQNNGTRAILDALTAQRIEAKDAKIAEQNQMINALNLAASQAAQNNYIVNQLRPCPVPAYNVPNPYATYGYGCGCNTGCGC